MQSKHVALYTAMIGNRDYPRNDVPLIFTEHRRFKDNRMNAKIYKILSHQWVDAEWSIWIDGNIELLVSPEELVEMADGHDITVFSHPMRDCLYEEAEVCKAKKKDQPAIIDAQTARYRQAGFPEHAGLGACFLIIRRNSDRIKRLNEQWWAEISCGSVRDQISFPYVFQDVVHYLPYTKLGENMHVTPYFILYKHLQQRTLLGKLLQR